MSIDNLTLDNSSNYYTNIHWNYDLICRYIVDSVWTHDKDLPAIKTDNGHYNNSVRIRKGDEGIMLIKNPREDNLIVAQSHKKARVEVHEPPRGEVAIDLDKKEVVISKTANISTTPTAYELRKCLSGDETLILSGKSIATMRNF